MLSEEDTATSNMHKKFGEVRLCSFRVMRVDRQTDVLIIIFCTPPGGEVITQGAYNSGKPGKLREFVNSGKLRILSLLREFIKCLLFFVTQSETHKKMT